jgi:hypothetical protein
MPQPQGQLGRQELAGAPANAVGAEQTPAGHCFGTHSGESG